MKILVAYFSQTGNTRQIAEAIYREASLSNEAKLANIDDIGGDDLTAYDLVFLGSPIHAGGLAEQVKTLMASMPVNPSFKMAAFITHASSAYEKQGFEDGVQQFVDICNDKKIDYLGFFDCQGRLTPELHDMVKQMQKVSDDEWERKMIECDKHPNSEDEQMAREFAKEFITKSQ